MNNPSRLSKTTLIEIFSDVKGHLQSFKTWYPPLKNFRVEIYQYKCSAKSFLKPRRQT